MELFIRTLAIMDRDIATAERHITQNQENIARITGLLNQGMDYITYDHSLAYYHTKLAKCYADRAALRVQRAEFVHAAAELGITLPPSPAPGA